MPNIVSVIVHYQLSIVNCQFFESVPIYQLSIVNCQLSIDKLLPPNENARRCLPGNATPATPSLAGNPLPAKEQKPVADLAGATLPKPPESCGTQRWSIRCYAVADKHHTCRNPCPVSLRNTPARYESGKYACCECIPTPY